MVMYVFDFYIMNYKFYYNRNITYGKGNIEHTFSKSKKCQFRYITFVLIPFI